MRLSFHGCRYGETSTSVLSLTESWRMQQIIHLSTSFVHFTRKPNTQLHEMAFWLHVGKVNLLLVARLVAAFFPISRRLSVHLTSNSKWQWSWKNVTYRTNETFFFHLKWKSLNVVVSWCRLSLLVTGEIDIKREVCTAKKKIAVKMFHRLQQPQPCREKSSKFLELFKCNENLHFLTFHDSSRFTFPLDTCDPLTVSLTFVSFCGKIYF